MKRRVISLTSALLAIWMFFIYCFQTNEVYAEILEPKYFEVLSEHNLVDDSQAVILRPADIAAQSGANVKILPKEMSKGYGEDVILLPPQSTLTFEVNVPKAGGYHIIVDYFITQNTMENLNISVSINREYQFYESRNIKLPAVWKDKTKQYRQDDYGNDVYPSSERVFKWQSAVLNTNIYNLTQPLVFNFKEGKNTITIKNNHVELMVGKVIISPKLDIIPYSQYREQHKDKPVIEDEMIVIQGEDYVEKSESYIRGAKSNDHNVYPYHPVKKKINYLAPETWQNPGESVTYVFNVKKSGLYSIHFKYKQDVKKDFPVFKRIYIDGKVPFAELNEYAFSYSGEKYRNETLSLGNEKVLIYLEKGTHRLTVESTASPYFETHENLVSIIRLISDTALQIKFVTGNKVDKNRDWNIVEYVPTIKEDLLKSAEKLQKEYEKLSQIANKKDSYVLSTLKIAIDRLKVFADDPDKLVNNIDQFYLGGNSIAQQIALLLPELLKQPLAIDCIYVTGVNVQLPPPTTNFVRSIIEGTKKLILSFTTEREASQKIEKDKLNVWVNRSIPHVEVLREKIENEFTPKTGIKVNVSTMPDEQKLLLANSAGRAPDVVLGASSYRPFDFALRGALYDLRQFEDFGEYIRDYPSEMFIPFSIGDSCYAIPETVNVSLLFYRKDILEKLKLEVPETWDDVVKILPTLSRYGMSFNTMIANVGGLKHFGVTVPFIHQFGGKIYSADGTKVELGDPNTVKAFKFMTDLYTKYSLPENIENFYNNFRYGVTPIGMSDFNTYILLKNAAPEIMGQWGIAPSVGVRSEKGEVLRYHPAVNTSCIIMKSTKWPKESWEFIKWWMDTDTQVSYANEMQLRYGPEYIWTSANLKAFMQCSVIDQNDKEVILTQYQYIKEIPRNPAYFAVERELSNAWNKVVFDGVPPRIALDQAIILSNREIRKKLKEFGYIDSEGNIVKPFKTITASKIDSWKE